MANPRFTIDDPATFLSWLAERIDASWASFDEVDVAQIFAVSATAALARHDGAQRLTLVPASASGAARFAHAVGIDEVLDGSTSREPTERERTVTLSRVRNRSETEAVARKIVDLMIPSHTARDAADLYWFVLVELLRNVVQHSQDTAGGVVAAQLNDAGPYQGNPTVQVVVADNGVGVFESLRATRPGIRNPAEALTNALEPHVSGAFREGGSGTVENAGLGLFFISEMAKKTRGRLLLASRGGTYFLDRFHSDRTQPVITNSDAPDYPGTLVVFETALNQVGSYEAIISGIHELARERTPQRITHRWIRFDEQPGETDALLVNVAAEDTVAAHEFSSSFLEPRLLRREPVVLDFRNLRVCTQSFLHALLHEAVRLAWARKSNVYVVNATPSVRAQIEFVESYSLGG